MGIIFDGRKFKSPDGVSNGPEIDRFSSIATNALEGDDIYSFKLKKNSLVVKSKATRFSGDPTLKTLTIKGSFENVDPNDEKTWKSAKVDNIKYKGKDGIILVKETGDKDSLGSLYDWKNVERFDEFVFRGDDIIYSDKKISSSSSNYLRGFNGNDTFYLNGGEDVEGGKGKDKSVVTKNAVKSFKSKGKWRSIEINDANSVEGDTVEVNGKESNLPSVESFRQDKYVSYTDEDEGSEFMFIDFIKQPVFADFVTG